MTIRETSFRNSDTDEFDLNSASTWKKLSSLLEISVRYFIYSSHISSWKGQEKDIIEDIVQETTRRIFERSQKADRCEAPPIQSLRRMVFTVARNYYTDLCRRDHRLLHIPSQETTRQVYLNPKDQIDIEEVGIENVYQEMLFGLVAREIGAFPDKQRKAILIDIANRMYFGKQPTLLQQAFLDTGIDLRQYHQALPSNTRERSRHAALVSYAYHRVASLRKVQEYIALV